MREFLNDLVTAVAVMGFICALPLFGCAPIGKQTAAVPERVLDGTVRIATDGGHGSGFAVDEDTIVTAAHVAVMGIDKVTTRAGEVCYVESIAVLWHTDAAIVNVSNCELHPLRRRVSQARAGEAVYMAGHPRNEDWTITRGIVADEDAHNGSRIMVDAVGLPGMSGGPVTDENGQVIGIAVSILPSMGLRAMAWGGETFAVPIDEVDEWIQ